MKRFALTIAVGVTSLIGNPADAHFPWLMTDDAGHATLHFGESIEDRTYAMPPAVAGAQILTGDRQVLKMNPVETDDFVGLKSADPVAAPAELSSKIVYGNYHGTELIYTAQHFAGRLPSIDAKTQSTDQASTPLHSHLQDTDTGVTCTVDWNGNPLGGAEVKLFGPDGQHDATATTDALGQVSFTDEQVEPGLGAIMVGRRVEPSTDADGNPVAGQSHYLTATFRHSQDNSPPLVTSQSKTKSMSNPVTVPDDLVDVSVDDYPAIPESVTSFGAAVCQGSLYIYGGHTGDAHHYDDQTQANTLWRLPLDRSARWQSMGTGPRLQGLAMVSTGDKLYQLGGFTAKNKVDEEHDLWSQDRVAAYDPQTQKWSDMPSLPEPRSSFDAAILDGQIYVVGGWAMAGDADADWLKTAYRLDPSADSPQWVALSPPPFQRRALSVAAHDGKIYAIGGMGADGGPTTGVDIYDPQTDEWSAGPLLHGEPMDGFGSASFATGGRLYVTTYSGWLQRLSQDGSQWEVVAKLDRDRFFHRLLPIGENKLVTLGGASMSSGKFEEIEVLTIR